MVKFGGILLGNCSSHSVLIKRTTVHYVQDVSFPTLIYNLPIGMDKKNVKTLVTQVEWAAGMVNSQDQAN